MRKTRFTKVLALTLVLLMVMSSTVFGAVVPATRISNTLEATFNVSEPGKVKNATTSKYYDSIQAALNEANKDDRIEVGAGIYTEKIVILKPVQLIGAGADKTTLNPITETKRTLILGNEGTPGVDLTGTIIQGFTINTPVPQNGQETAAVYLTAHGSEGKEIEIRNNTIVGLTGEQTGKYNGIVSPYSILIKHYKIINNTLNSISYGMYFNDMSNIVVDGNTIDGTNRAGIVFYGSEGNKCDYITIANNKLNNISKSLPDSEPVWDSGISFFRYGQNITVSENTINMLNGRKDVYYYVSPIANVSDLAGLYEALNDTNITTINITADIITDKEIIVNRPVKINGGGHSISFTGNADGWNGDYVLHVYRAAGVTIDNIKLLGADGALLVNGSEVILTGPIDVSENEFGGIEVSQGENVTEIPRLTINGTLVNNSEEIGLPTAWIDGGIGTIESTPNLTQINIDNQKQFYIVSTKANPIILTGLSGTIEAKINELKEIAVTASYNTNVESVQNAKLVIDVIKVGSNITSTDLTINDITGTFDSENNKITFISDLTIGNNNLSLLFNATGQFEFDVYVTQ